MLSNYFDFYKGTSAYNDATSMPVILENGRKVFGPPHKYAGLIPSHICELYVTHIPTQINELGFLVWLHRIGQVYTFRLMMDTGNTNRGYAFVRFCSEKDALAAYELLKYLFVDGERFSVFRSQGKNRLFISGIPRDLPIPSLENGFRLCFPTMQSCTAYPAIKKKLLPGRETEENRGFSFIEFENHEMALAAKKRLNTGRVGMWGADLKIQWAKPKEELQPTIGPKNFNDVSRLYPHSNKPNDYCAKLHLYCLANNLSIPILLYGPNFRLLQLHYAGILIKNSFTGFYCYYLFEIAVDKVSDIHLLICEIVVKIIEECNGKLNQNAVIRAISDTKAELVYNFKHCEELKNYLKLQNHIRYSNVLIELASSLQILAQQNHEKLLLLYKHSFLTHQAAATFCLEANNTLTRFCAVFPKFRYNPKLNNNLNDFEITLLLISSSSTLPQHPNKQLIACISQKVGANTITAESQLQRQQRFQFELRSMKKCPIFKLKSQHSGFGIKYTLRYVDLMAVETRQCYHPEQQVNSNPIWIAGHSYQQSIYN